MKRLILLLLLTGLGAICYARMGETIEQCRVRYGHEKTTNDFGQIVFEAHDTIIGVTLESNKVARIAYWRPDQGIFSYGEREFLLHANADEVWKLDNLLGGKEVVEAGGLGYIAPLHHFTATVFSNRITITTQAGESAYSEGIRQRAVDKAAKKLSGF